MSRTSTPSNDWSVKPNERDKYEQLFESLQPQNGLLPGYKVKDLLLDSKLPMQTLGQIWELADMDQDGCLNKHEFVIAMHLVYKALEKFTIPNCVPAELLPMDISTNIPSSVPWVVLPEEKMRYDKMFKMVSNDEEGYISGSQAKTIFLNTNVPQITLAKIWNLCDIQRLGKLNAEQFALAMWLIQQALKGVEPPLTLPSEMMPPSFRSRELVNDNNNIVYTNKEIEMINKDISDLAQEKQVLEREIIQNEADIQIKSGEVKNLHNELDSLISTFKQLENQQIEAQKRLDDLKNQKAIKEKDFNDLTEIVHKESTEIERLQKQLASNCQENDITLKRQEIDELKRKEERMEIEQRKLSSKLNTLCSSLQDFIQTMNYIKASITKVQESRKQLKRAIEIIDNTLSGKEKIDNIPNSYLHLQQEYKYEEKFNEKEKFNQTSFAFKEDLFKNTNDVFSSGFDTDPFANGFPLTSNQQNNNKQDPFDPFGYGNTNKQNNVDNYSNDPFGFEPFEAPALPSRDSKPPPRPPAPHSRLRPKSIPKVTLDFTEDPFKNYRYEDPFAMDDPFAEK